MDTPSVYPRLARLNNPEAAGGERRLLADLGQKEARRIRN
jgi:hypothetical protein